MAEELILPPHILDPDPEIYLSKDYSTVDVETTNEEKGSATNPNNRLLLTSYSRQGRKGIESVWGNEYQAAETLDEIADSTFIIAHNAKFELQWFQRAGVDTSKVVVWDTLLAEYVIAGNRRVRLDLDSVAKKYGVGQKESIVSLLIKGGVCPSAGIL